MIVFRWHELSHHCNQSAQKYRKETLCCFEDKVAVLWDRFMVSPMEISTWYHIVVCIFIQCKMYKIGNDSAGDM